MCSLDHNTPETESLYTKRPLPPLNPKSAVEDLLETRNNSLAAPRPSARPLWSEGTATHPFFASRRPNRPAGLLFGSFLLPNSDDAARLCQDRVRGWRALGSIQCRRSHRKGQPRRSISCAGPQGGTHCRDAVRRSALAGHWRVPAASRVRGAAVIESLPWRWRCAADHWVGEAPYGGRRQEGKNLMREGGHRRTSS